MKLGGFSYLLRDLSGGVEVEVRRERGVGFFSL